MDFFSPARRGTCPRRPPRINDLLRAAQGELNMELALLRAIDQIRRQSQR